MFLKQLSLKGFKSFAGTTHLDLEPGVTVIVGPNGSGKSNVVDAIAWVLGAQGPKTLRSAKMDDVIFAGSANTGALGRAEVALTIDNSSGLLPIEFTEVTIKRTLFRSGDSEYSLNGVSCRLLDIQELLSDTGVGRQQHIIIAQGQIDAVLSARTEERRAIIEEAAGILKYRRRKEKAERRLDATEGNLLRLQDLLREVRRQLKPLQRQADAAQRHGGIATELRNLKLYVAGRDLEQLAARTRRVAVEKATFATEQAELKATLVELDVRAVAASSALDVPEGIDTGESLARLEGLRARIRGLQGRMTERQSSLVRALGAMVDAEVVASLEADSAKLISELEEVENKISALAPELAELEADEELYKSRQSAFDQLPEISEDSIGARLGEVRGELAVQEQAVQRAQVESDRLESRLALLTEKSVRQATETTALSEDLTNATEAEPRIVAEHKAAELKRAEASAAVEAATSERDSAAADRHHWAARAEALQQALDQLRQRAGVDRLAGLDGILGTLLELVEIDKGWEAAFESAVGEALTAVVAENVEAAKAALGLLREGNSAGAVLALGVEAEAYEPISSGEAVRGHVRGKDARVDALLDVLVGQAVVADGGWTEALDISLRNPRAVVVTNDGDRFASSSWRVGGDPSGATGAALEEALAEAARSETQLSSKVEQLEKVQLEFDAAREAASLAGHQLDRNDAALSVCTESIERLGRERSETDSEIAGIKTHLLEIGERAARDLRRRDELTDLLPELETQEAIQTQARSDRHQVEQNLTSERRAVASRRADFDLKGASFEERKRLLSTRLEETEKRLAGHVEQRQQAAERRLKIEQQLLSLERMQTQIKDRLGIVVENLQAVRDLHRSQTEATRHSAHELESLRVERLGAEKRLEEIVELTHRLDVEDTEGKIKLQSVLELVRGDLESDPEAAKEVPSPELPDSVSAPARIRELDRELRLMGPINPLALSEFTELSERQEFLQEQLDDVRTSRKDLNRVIKQVNDEITHLFSEAFADVSANFTKLFETLFPGGQGALSLTEPEDLLRTGIEIDAKPSGKNVRKLSLLSGGERSLVALAFLFAVFRSRPSPFYVMDEVEAALDDMNLQRFLSLVHEFRGDAQLMLVSHQKRTMEAADCLYGVSMGPGGASVVVSERVGS